MLEMPPSQLFWQVSQELANHGHNSHLLPCNVANAIRSGAGSSQGCSFGEAVCHVLAVIPSKQS
jgi:hypothetical protein